MKATSAIAGGLAGTITVAALHEALKRVTPDAPRMDLLDMALIRKGLNCIHREAPDEITLQRWAVGGELLCDTGYFSLAGMGGRRGAWLRGALLGLFAGLTAVVSPKPFGLPDEWSSRTKATGLMTVGLYLAGGLAAAAIARAYRPCSIIPHPQPLTRVVVLQAATPSARQVKRR